MSITTPKTQDAGTSSQVHSETAHQHVELIRLLEENSYIFPQNPAVISRAVKFESASAFDKLFIRAERIDSNGAIRSALDNAQFSISASKKLLYAIYFILGFIGVLGLLSTGAVNFFYLLIALLGWHTLSLLLWIISTLSRRQGVLMSMIDRVTLTNPLIQRLLSGENMPFKMALTTIGQTLKPIKSWYLSAIMHSAWLFGLFGTLLALLSLFLFRHYEFVWESTLLSDAHFIKMMTAIGFLPHLLGVPLPNFHAPRNDAAAFAWLVMAVIILYGIVPRMLAWIISAYRAKHRFSIDTNLAYYARLLNDYREEIIDKDDYTPLKPAAKAISVQPNQPLILAMLERTMNTAKLSFRAEHEFGVVDSRDEMTALISQAQAAGAIIYLTVSTHTPPDRGLMRKIDTLRNAMLNHGGIIVQLISDDTLGQHYSVWTDALGQHGVPLAVTLN